MTSLLGIYWSVMHRRPQDYVYFKKLQPSVFKIMDGGPPDYTWAKDNLPNSLVIARDWALSEQHADMLEDPTATGKRHAQEWNTHQARLGFDKAKTLILGINEPKIWEGGVAEALRQYTIALCNEATVYGLRVGAMQLAVGWPNNKGAETPPGLVAFHGVDVAIRANNGALVCHEYWADRGPKENWGWWGGRSLKCPWQVPIIIGECGVDMYVKDGSVAHASRGWRGRMEPPRYATELVEYSRLMGLDSRFVGCAVFASDYANREWFSFDVEPAYQAILATPPPEPQPPKPEPPKPPDPGPEPPAKGEPLLWPVSGQITSWFGEPPAVFNSPGHNGIDIACHTGSFVVAVADGEVMYSGFDKDYGNYCRVWHPGYHFHSFFAHLHEVKVSVGLRVQKGQVLALSGNTGNSTGPHLHYELRGGTRDGYYNVSYGYTQGRFDPRVAYLLTGAPLQPGATT